MKMGFAELRDFLRNHLVNNVMPFWMKHGVDFDKGGLFSYLTDEGTKRSRNKHMLSNTRALWTSSALVNRIEDREQWRRAARNQFDFLRRHGRNENGDWVFITDEDGNALQGAKSIIIDAFALCGLVEYFQMSGDTEAIDLAFRTYRTAQDKLARPGSYETAPYPTPEGMRPQRESMQFSLMFAELGHAADDDDILEEGLKRGRDVLDNFYRPDRDVLVEYVNNDNTLRDSPEGRAMVPGHGIETLWFQIHTFTKVGDVERARQAARAMRCCFEKGWDPKYGGLFLGIDIDGKEPPYWQFAEYKRWWPHTEALCGALLAYEQIEEDWCLNWYWKAHDWSFEHFPVPEHGEWTQNLTREGVKIAPAPVPSDDEDEILKAFPIKDPFHLARGLIVSIEVLNRLGE